MKATNEPTAVLLIRGVERQLRRLFKSACARRGQSMTERIKELMMEDLIYERMSHDRTRTAPRP